MSKRTSQQDSPIPCSFHSHDHPGSGSSHFCSCSSLIGSGQASRPLYHPPLPRHSTESPVDSTIPDKNALDDSSRAGIHFRSGAPHPLLFPRPVQPFSRPDQQPISRSSQPQFPSPGQAPYSNSTQSSLQSPNQPIRQHGANYHSSVGDDWDQPSTSRGSFSVRKTEHRGSIHHQSAKQDWDRPSTSRGLYAHDMGSRSYQERNPVRNKN